MLFYIIILINILFIFGSKQIRELILIYFILSVFRRPSVWFVIKESK